MHTDELEWELGQDRMASENSMHESVGRMLRNLILEMRNSLLGKLIN